MKEKKKRNRRLVYDYDVHVKIKKETFDNLNEMVKKTGKSRAKLIRIAITDFLDKYN